MRELGIECLTVFGLPPICRSDSKINDLASVNPALIGYVQLSDVPLQSTNPDDQDEAMFERLPPG